MKSVLSVSTGHCLAAAAWQILLCKPLLLGQNCALTAWLLLLTLLLTAAYSASCCCLSRIVLTDWCQGKQVEPEQIDREGGDRL